MPARSSRYLLCIALCAVGAGELRAQTPVVATAHSIAGGGSTTRVDPVEQTLTISTAGIYNLTLTDLKQPVSFAEVTLAVTSGTTLVGSATVSAGAAPAVAQVNAPVGTYVVHVIGALTSGQFFGTAGVQLTNASGTPVNGFAGPGGTMVSGFTATLSLPPAPVPPNARVIDTMIMISAAGAYELDLKDLQFPAALGTLTVNLADPSGNLVSGFPISAAGGVQRVMFTVAATATGNYHLVGGAQAASGAAGGLYNVHVFGTSTQTDVLNETDPLGQVASLGAATLSAGGYSLALTDFAFPKSLAQGIAAAVQGQSIVASTAGGSPASFTAVAGNCQLFALAVPDMTAGSGAYGVTLAPQGGATVFSAVQTTSSGTGGVAAYTYPVAVTTGGSYTLTLADFQFPLSFATLELAAAQNGVLLGTPLTAPGTVQINPTAGQVFVLAAATAGTGGKGIFGVDLTPSTGGTPVLDLTQGVGGAFGTTTVPISTAGSYNVTLSDLAFPGNFNELAAVVTQGPTRLGSIFTSGTFSFTATPGSYVINVLGTPQPIIASSAQTAGTYGVSVAPTPPVPTVTLTPSATQVNSGDTVTLTWSSQNATGCTATGGWSGALATSGTQVSAALTSLTTFTLTCTGGGGSSMPQSVMVSVKPPSSSGGGSLDGLMLLLLALGAGGKALTARIRLTA
jgi:plastocyanin